jgi:hypothetical protein
MAFSTRYPTRYNSAKPAKPNKPADDAGDFDDMGKGKTASAYHYANKKRLGRF